MPALYATGLLLRVGLRKGATLCVNPRKPSGAQNTPDGPTLRAYHLTIKTTSITIERVDTGPILWPLWAFSVRFFRCRRQRDEQPVDRSVVTTRGASAD